MRRNRSLFVAAVALTAAWLGCEWAQPRNEQEFFAADKALSACWAHQAATLPQCRELVAQRKALDLDNGLWCEAGLAACKANGVEARAVSAEDALDRWLYPRGLLRLAMLCMALVGLGMVLAVGVKWLRRSLSGPA